MNYDEVFFKYKKMNSIAKRIIIDQNFVLTEDYKMLLEDIKTINAINPLDVELNGSKPKQRKTRFYFDENGRKVENLRNVNFTYPKKPEHLIQRHLMYSCWEHDLYTDFFGKLIGYEVPSVGETYPGGIDLVSYKNGELLLIELKACDIERDDSESKESILRAIFEINTYWAFFKNTYDRNEKFRDKISELVGTDDDIRNFRKVILVPLSMTESYKYLGDLLTDVEVYAISKNENFDKNNNLNTPLEMFTIKKVN